MATVRIEEDDLVVTMEGMDKLWSLKSRLAIPLLNVRGATADPGITKGKGAIRAPGAYVPGVITAGTFYQDGERVFWDVRDSANTVVIELADDRYARLVIEVDDPRATVSLIEGAIRPS